MRVWACRSKQPFMQCYTQGSQLFQGDLASAFVLSECIGKRQTKKPCSTYGTSGNRAQLQHRTPAEASLGSDRLHLKTAGATSGCCSPRCIGLHVLSPSFSSSVTLPFFLLFSPLLLMLGRRTAAIWFWPLRYECCSFCCCWGFSKALGVLLASALPVSHHYVIRIKCHQCHAGAA